MSSSPKDDPPTPAPRVDPSDVGATAELVRRLAGRSTHGARYTDEGEVGRGGMGAIRKIWDVDLRRHLAMKVVLARGDATDDGAEAIDPRQLARFLEEAQVTGQLDHPGIVPVHELGLDDAGRVYFTMKLVKGRDLRQVFDLVFEEREGWNETRALSTMLKVCEALAYAHAKGVIHRDLKPANVMVGGFGEVFVMDWGLARVLGRRDSHDIRLAPELPLALSSVRTERRDEREDQSDSPIVTMDGDVVGTPAYMPPEQARGETEKLTPRADVYAIGAMLYHLLARRAPYSQPGARIGNRTVLGLVIHGPPTALAALRDDVPAELVAIVEKAMAREPEARYADTLELAEDLRAYLEHRVVGAYETGAWAEAKKWLQRNRSLAAALAAAVLLLVVGLTASLVFKSRADEQARIAEEKERRAVEQERIAKRTADDVLSLATIQELKDLEDEGDRLWPAHPANLAAFERWLADAHALIDGHAADAAAGVEAHPSLAQHESKLAEIRSRASKSPAPDATVDDPSAFEFDVARDRWWHLQLSQLVHDLRAFADPAHGWIGAGVVPDHGPGIAARAATARTLVERSIEGAAARAAWDDAIARIASSDRYGGLVVRPQFGLLPLGMDPDSHLFEFAHLETGEPARRGAEGELVLGEETGLVLVLVPGGEFLMGAQSSDPYAPNFDPSAMEGEGPPHEVPLEPYFLSKYEMTQAQWTRIMGWNHSFNDERGYGPEWNRAQNPWTALHPVEQVTWNDCEALLRRIALVMPTEAQWEHACRAGTDTPFWTGADAMTLADAANFADQFARAHGGEAWSVKSEAFDDGNTTSAEIGSYCANPFGLHDVHGNVREWCRDFFGSYDWPVRAGDGERIVEHGEAHVTRGGNWSDAASKGRSSQRDKAQPNFRSNALGLRPARPLLPDSAPPRH